MRPDIFLGNELADIRVRDALRAAEAHRLLATADEGRRRRRLSIGQPAFPRPPVRRPSVDDCVFEDLGRSLAPHD